MDLSPRRGCVWSGRLKRRWCRRAEGAASHVVQEVADCMAAHWGGLNFYFSIGIAGKLCRRDRQIYEEFNSTNQSDLTIS